MTKYLDSAPFLIPAPAKEFRPEHPTNLYADKFPDLVDQEPDKEEASDQHSKDALWEMIESRERMLSLLVPAARSLLERYTGLVRSGDAGDWNPEEEKCVRDMRVALLPFRDAVFLLDDEDALARFVAGEPIYEMSGCRVLTDIEPESNPVPTLESEEKR